MNELIAMIARQITIARADQFAVLRDTPHPLPLTGEEGPDGWITVTTTPISGGAIDDALWSVAQLVEYAANTDPASLTKFKRARNANIAKVNELVQQMRSQHLDAVRLQKICESQCQVLGQATAKQYPTPPRVLVRIAAAALLLLELEQ